MENNKRRSIKFLAILGGAASYAPTHWSKPLVDAIILPAHAMTSNENTCSGYETETVDEAILISIVGDEVRGPIVGKLERNEFSVTQTVNLGQCGDGSKQLTQATEFSGVLDSVQNTLIGRFNIRQFCGDTLACEQLAEFSAEQTQAQAGNDQGQYSGRVVGTLRCCVDFL